MQLLRQGTAATLVIGPFVDDTDGKTAETGLTISQADVLLHKSDGTSIAKKNDATSATHRSSGYYTVPLNSTDTGTLGRLRVMVSESGALPVFHDFMVVPAVVYDSLVGGTDYLQVDAVQVEGDDATNQIRDALVDDATRIDASALNTLSSHDPGENIMGATDLGTGSGLTSLATQASVNTVAGYIDTEVAAILAAVDTEVAAIKAKTDNLPASPAAVGSAMTLASGAITAAVIATGAIDADALATDAGTEIGAAVKTAVEAAGSHLALIKAKTDNLPASPAAVGSQMDLVNAPNATAVTAIQSGLATAAALDAVDNFVDTEVAAIKAVTDKLDTAMELDSTVYRFTTNALEQGPSGSGATAQQVWEYATRTLTSAGAGGATAQEVWEYATRTLTSGGGTVDIAALAAAIVAALSGSLTVTTPVSVDGTSIELVQGDDYFAADGRALEWTRSDWPDLTGATITLNVQTASGIVTIAGTAPVVGAGVEQTVRAEMTAAETASLDIGFNDFDVKAVLASTHVVRLALGKCHVLDNVG